MPNYYDRDSFAQIDARRLHSKLVTITTWPDDAMDWPAGRFENVRCMYAGGHFILLLADTAPGPAEQVYFDVIKTVEVHA